jgi:hypothetical protein
MLIDVVRQLGAEADERWAREDYALDAFASIAADAIERFSLHDLFDLAEFADWLTETEDLLEQLHAKNKFGDPRITGGLPDSLSTCTSGRRRRPHAP